MGKRDAYREGTFCWVDLASLSMDGAIDFYSELLGWSGARLPVDDQGQQYGFFTVDGAAVAGLGELNAEMKANGVPPTWNSYVAVDDAAATLERVTAHGGTVVAPVMQAMEAGSLAFFADPEGAVFGVWQADQHHGASLVNQPGTWCWNELNAQDPAAAVRFYSAVFGWEADAMDTPNGPYHLIRANGGMNAGVVKTNPQLGSTMSTWTVYFNVADVDAALLRLQALGGQVRVPAFDTAAGRIAVVNDAQGTHFSLIGAERWDD